MIGCLQTRVRKQPIIVLCFEFENELKFYNLEAWLLYFNMRGSSGGQGVLGGQGVQTPISHPLKSHRYIGVFLAKLVQISLKNHKATKQAFNVGPSSARQ